MIPMDVSESSGDDSGCECLILDSWLRSYHHHSGAWLGWLTYEGFASLYGPMVRRILRRSVVRVARLRSDRCEVVGWAAAEGSVVHYIFVKGIFRREGVARTLLAGMLDKPAIYTHETLTVRRKLSEKVPLWKYSPEILGERRGK